MEPTKFDALARIVAQRISRRDVLKGAAIGLAAAAPIRLSQASAASAAADLVLQYYENVDAYQYADAYALLGSKWHSQQSLANLTKGYADTAFVQCQATSEQPSGANTIVHVKLISWHNDGTIVAYTGSYTVGPENGKTLILSGSNTKTTVPAGTPHLCTIADLSFSFGQWTAGAGQRFSSLVAKNASSATCVVGGSPRILIDTANHHELASTSEIGNPPTAIKLAPGASAHADLRFTNWCESTSGNTVRVDVPGDTHRGTVSSPVITYPPCLGSGESAGMQVKAFQSGAA